MTAQAQRFAYKALDADGARADGVIDAADERAALAKLEERGLAPFSLRARAASRRRTAGAGRRISNKDYERYLRQLATLLSANVSLLEALTTLSQSGAHGALADRTKTLRRELRAGKRFSQALEAEFPELPDYAFRLAELGEATGSLAEAMTDAADRMAYEQTMRSEVRSALTYPMFLATVGTLIVVLMFIFVVPRFATLLGDNISQAPALSRAVIGFGLWMRDNTALAAFIGALALGGAYLGARSKAIREELRASLTAAPLVGPFLRRAELGGWARTVAVALRNKARLVDALRLGEDGAQTRAFRKNLETVRKRVRAGDPLEEALGEAQRDIDPVILDLIRTGRNAGKLAEMLAFAADLYEKEARERAKRLTALAEPMAILVIAAIVGMIVVSIVMAMTSLYQFEL